MSAIATAAFGVITVIKVATFVFAVRNALRPQPVPPVDMDGPDEGWRWWEEFGPEPEPQRPGGVERELTRA